MKKCENEIVVYQPDETTRLDVRVADESVWLNQKQLCTLFGVVKSNVSYHLKRIFETGELDAASTVQEIRTVQIEGDRHIGRTLEYFNLDVIISLGYRINSKRGIQFRQWATRVLKEFMLRGYAFGARVEELEERMERRLTGHDRRIETLEGKVDFFVRTSLPPVQGVFYDGQMFDADVFATKHILSAKWSIWLADPWVDVVTLEMLSKKANGVTVDIVTSPKGNRLMASDIARFNAQYGGLTVRESIRFHDRFLAIDDEQLFLVGASLKDLGRKCFAFAQLDAGAISELKRRTQ